MSTDELGEPVLTGLAVLGDLRKALADQGLDPAVAVVDEHAAAMLALLAPGWQLTITAGRYYLADADPVLPVPNSAQGSSPMTQPITTEPFDLRTAKIRAAEIVDQNLCAGDDMGPLQQFHDQVFTALGATPDAIAATIIAHGIKGSLPELIDDGGEIYGDMHDAEGNALAVFFREVCGAAVARFGTDYGLLYWDGSAPGVDLGYEGLSLPQTVETFLRRYEDFAYPDLYTAAVPEKASQRSPEDLPYPEIYADQA